MEIDARYAAEIEGVEVTPILVARAPRFVYVLGEVHLPGRFVLEGPTTVMQAISLAGSWNVGANIKQIVIFRRGDDWRLMATMVDLQAALGGKNLCPAGETVARRLRRGARAQIEDPEDRRLHQSGFLARGLRRVSVHHELHDQLDQRTALKKVGSRIAPLGRLAIAAAHGGEIKSQSPLRGADLTRFVTANN